MSLKRVLILGLGDRAFLAVARSLGRAGLTVHAINTSSTEPLPASKYIQETHSVFDFDKDSKKWLSEMLKLMQDYTFDLVVPTDDQSIIPIQMHLKHLEKYAKIYTLNKHAYDIASNKNKSRQVAEALGVPLAKGCVVDSFDAANQLAKSYGWPIVAKPLSSFDASNLSSKKFVKIVRNEKHLKSLFDTNNKNITKPSFVLEQYFQGIGVGIEFIAKDGIPLYMFQHERVHEPLEGGGSSYRKSVAVDARLAQYSSQIIQKLDYSGVGMVEFKMSPDRASFIFIEINGRFWGSLPLAVAAGANFPLWLFEMIVHGETNFTVEYKKNIYARNFLKDIGWMVKNYRADHDDPTLITRSSSSVAAELLNLLKGKESFDSFALDDPKPFLMDIKQLVSKVLDRFLIRPINVRWHASGFARRKARRLINNVFMQSGQVLFVCKGNICRSPFAKEYAEKISSNEVQWYSAGYFPVSGRSSPDSALAASQKFGISLNDHRSQEADKIDLNKYSLIIVFDKHNYQSILGSNGNIKGKLIFLGQLSNTQDIEIPDPYGESIEYFESIYESIKNILDEVLLE
ncbi:MAG: hypothetical protein GKR92_06855 [Gammaproteobacteria bacterium]|nr:MAG: hypothetical protein GKR92_06855 [Gammaproteobacteria bacterium]